MQRSTKRKSFYTREGRSIWISQNGIRTLRTKISTSYRPKISREIPSDFPWMPCTVPQKEYIKINVDTFTLLPYIHIIHSENQNVLNRFKNAQDKRENLWLSLIRKLIKQIIDLIFHKYNKMWSKRQQQQRNKKIPNKTMLR